MKSRYFKQSFFAILAILLLVNSSSFAGNIDPDDDDSQYAWGENIGWINFEPTEGDGVTVTDTAVTGEAWGENVGWIVLDPTYGGVSNDGGVLTGCAWGENVGWISFSCDTVDCNTVIYGVTIDPATGVFSGKAWGENIGWISFHSADSVPFEIVTSWRGDLCECDLNTDGRCDMQDWLLFGQDWGRTDCNDPGVDCECDLNNDGRCDMQDWLLFGQDWGRTDCP